METCACGRPAALPPCRRPSHKSSDSCHDGVLCHPKVENSKPFNFKYEICKQQDCNWVCPYLICLHWHRDSPSMSSSRLATSCGTQAPGTLFSAADETCAGKGQTCDFLASMCVCETCAGKSMCVKTCACDFLAGICMRNVIE